ncbi:hypothetical protein [Burkholderia ubonensis]|uniref:hypothetical protein n=1 Tax=Burkholderia ubonensis TaxID=101571 RepID=UPI000A95B2AE|nr:hypothetical protein [Burkholderia ubonensis]MDY7787964.1 hypothetical protein [Burkholderia ubonensis]
MNPSGARVPPMIARSFARRKNMHRNPKRWRAVHDALAVTAIAAVECALVMGLIAAIGFPHGGL